MTDRPRNLVIEELPLDLLNGNWDTIVQVAPRIASEIEIKSEGLSGNFLREAMTASQFLQNDPTYERTLNQPCVLAILAPLAQMATKGPLTENEIAKAVSIGLCSLSRHGTTHRSLFRIFIYPILLTYFATLGCILISHFIVPYFEEMYVEFGVMVPRMTTFFFYVGHLFRTYTITILLILLGVPPLLWLINWIGHENRPPGMSRLDVMLSRKRSTTARWLFHLSLLLDAGLTKEDAIERAASISGKLWIKRKAVAFKNNIDDASNVNVRFFGGQKSRMADTAISMPRSRGQVALLRHVATWYRDSSSNLIEWLVQLLIPLYVFCILIGSLLLIVSLLSPILSVISALTGGGGGAPGGFM